MQSDIWNTWHGCTKYSEGCRNCYVYRRDGSVGRDASIVAKNADFDKPVRKYRDGSYKYPSGSHLYVCMTSDFFLDKADEWRDDVWAMIRQRSDMYFTIITKRIVRFEQCKPSDWGDGYENVSIICTMENQKECDVRFPVLNSLPIKHKGVACEPLLSPIDMSEYLNDSIEQVVVGGESGNEARVCDYNWILGIRSQCVEKNVKFYFKQTGAKFLKDGKLYLVPRKLQHIQARKAGINTLLGGLK